MTGTVVGRQAERDPPGRVQLDGTPVEESPQPGDREVDRLEGLPVRLVEDRGGCPGDALPSELDLLQTIREVGLHGARVLQLGIEVRLVEVQREERAIGGDRQLAGVLHPSDRLLLQHRRPVAVALDDVQVAVQCAGRLGGASARSAAASSGPPPDADGTSGAPGSDDGEHPAAMLVKVIATTSARIAPRVKVLISCLLPAGPPPMECSRRSLGEILQSQASPLERRKPSRGRHFTWGGLLGVNHAGASGLERSRWASGTRHDPIEPRLHHPRARSRGRSTWATTRLRHGTAQAGARIRAIPRSVRRIRGDGRAALPRPIGCANHAAACEENLPAAEVFADLGGACASLTWFCFGKEPS